MKRFWFVAIMVVVSLVALACSSAPTTPTATPKAPTSTPTAPTPAPTAAPKPKTINLSFGSTSSSSGAYVWSVAMARVVNKYVPGVSITVVESGASYDNVRKIKEGVFDGGLCESWTAGFEMQRGIETFKDNPWEPIRWLWLRDIAVSRTVVRADSGIKTWADLKGKKIYAGIPGSMVVEVVDRTNKLLNTGAEIVPGSLEDAIQGLQTGRIQAVQKNCSVNTFDASLMQVHLSKPLTAIGFSDDEAAKILKAYPTYLTSKTPANTIKENPGHAALWEKYTIAGGFTSSKLPEDVAYQIVKAVREHWSEVVQAYPSSGLHDTVADYMKTVPAGFEVPLHAGVVRYAKEAGINVPQAFIPPEYKAK